MAGLRQRIAFPLENREGGFSPRSGVYRQFIRNSSFNLLRGVAAGLSAVLITGVAARALDREAFGVWGLLGGLTNSIAFADLGIGVALSKRVAESSGENSERLNGVISSGIAAIGVLAACAALALWVIGALLTRDIRPSGPYATAAIGATVALFAGSTGVLLFGSAWGGILIGRQRTDLANLAQLAALAAYTVAALAAICTGLGPAGLAAASLLGAALTMALYAIQVRRVIPDFRPSWHSVRMREIRGLLGFGGHVQWGAAVSIIHANLDKVLLAQYWGMGAVSQFELALRVVSQARSVPVLLLQPIVPAISQLRAARTASTWLELHRQSVWVGYAVSAVVFVPLLLLSGPVITLLAGKPDEIAASLVFVLGLGMLFNSLTAPGFFALLGAGRPLAGSAGAGVGLAVHLAAASYLVPRFGPLGGAIASSAALIAGAVVFGLACVRTLRQFGREFTSVMQPPNCPPQDDDR